MVCRQIWRCRRRRCPRPFFVALVVAACLFYQTLTIIGRKTFTLPAMPGILQNPYVETQERDLKDVPTVTSFCLFSLDQLQRAKEIEDSNLKHFDERHVKRAILYAHPSINLKELQLYQRILTQQGYTVLVPEENEFNAALRQEKHYQGGISPWDLVICIPGRKRNANCMSKEDLSQLQFYQKVNLLPEIRHFLCRKEGLCQITRTFPELQLPVVASICSEQYIPSRTLPSAPKMARLHEVEETYFAQPQDWIHASKAQPNQAHLQGLPQEPLQTQDFASIIKAYVLVTSFKPLRAFIHSMGLIWHPPNKKHHAIKLPVFFAKFFKDGSSMHTFTNMKEAIIKLLVAAEVISEMSASESGPNNFQRYKLCFQFLTFDFGFNHSSYPVLLEVHEHFDFRVDDNLRHEDQNFKECLLEDAFRFLSPNMSATVSVFRALQDMIKLNMTKDETCWKKCNHCLSLDEIHLMMNFVREIKSLGRFELLFPSTSPKLQSMLRALYQKAAPRRKLDAVLGGHSFISSLLEQFQNLNRKVTTVNPMPRNTSRGKEITNDSIDSSGTGKDKVALSHIRQICTRPQLDLNPEFNPKIKDYYSEVPFDVVTVKISFSHDCQAHLDKQNGPSYANYPLGLGINHITVPVTEDSDPHAKFVSSYTITVYREDRPSMLLFDDYTMCGFIQGDFTWNSMSGRSVRLKSVPIQSLSELERARLQEVAFYRLQQDYDLGCQITIPKDGQKRKKSLRKKLDSLGKEKNKDKESLPQAFGMSLSQVIANDRAQKLKQDSQKEEEKEVLDFVASILPFGTRRSNKELSSSNSSLSSTSETPNESTSPNTPEPAPRARRRGAMSVDSITDLDDNQSRLLEALQLSLPAEAQSKKEKERDKKLSLNPIYRQVPRLVDSCCLHVEKNGLQTVGIFRVGSSKKRVRQLREEFDRGVDVVLDEEHSVHDVAALLKEFLRDMPDPLLTKELYTAFINTLLLEHEEQLSTLQLLIYLLPPCNCDTLHRLLLFLSTVANHADDTIDKDGQELSGNKMTSLNLATIFGPNLLHKQKSSDKEFSVQSTARAEESTIIIAVVQKMIENSEALFMVPPDLQNEVLISLLETDPDVVDYLLRRKASQSSSPELLRSDGSYSLEGRHSSTDSNKASSGDVSPYDNNSPILSERSLMTRPDEVASYSDKLFKVPEQYTLVGHMQSKSREGPTGPWAGKDVPEEPFNIWGTWHSTLKSGQKDQGMTGSYGNIYESSCLRQGHCSHSQGNLALNWSKCQDSSEELDNGKPGIRRTHTSAAIPESRPHAPVARVSSTPQIDVGRRSLDHSYSRSEQYLPASSSEDITEEQFQVACKQNKSKPLYLRQEDVNRNDARLPPPYPGLTKQNTVLPHRQTVSAAEQALWRQQRQETNMGFAEGGSTGAKSICQSASGQEKQLSRNIPTNHKNSKNFPEQDWQEWQRERWQIWELLSADNPDALPETLV